MGAKKNESNYFDLVLEKQCFDTEATLALAFENWDTETERSSLGYL